MKKSRENKRGIGSAGGKKPHHALESKVHVKDEDLPSKLTYAAVALLVLVLGFFAIRSYVEIPVGKAYQIVLDEGVFTESVEMELLANVPEKFVFSLNGPVESARLRVSGTAENINIAIDDKIVFASFGILDGEIFDFSEDVGKQCAAYPCEVPFYIFSSADGSVFLQDIDIKVREITKEEKEKEKSKEAETATIPILVLKYFPLNSDGKLDHLTTWAACTSDGKVYNDLDGTGIPCDLSIIRSYTDELTAEGIDLLSKGSAYKGYKDSSASPYIIRSVVATKEYLEEIPKTFNILDGNPEIGKWAPRPGFVGDSLLIDLGKEQTISKIALNFWDADRPEKFHVDISETGQFAGEEKIVIAELDGLSGYEKINPSYAIQRKEYNFNPQKARYIKLVADAWRIDDPEGNSKQINLYELEIDADVSEARESSPDASARANAISYLDKEGICDYVDNKGVREVWVWMYHSNVTYPVESNMAMGKGSKEFWNYDGYGDVSNSYRENDLPVCQNTYTVYEFNYGRGAGELMEDFGHHFEAIFKYLDDDLFWNRFVGPFGDAASLSDKPGVKHCGWTHFAPNGEGDYDWYSEEDVMSDCEDWSPDLSGQAKPVDCHTWSGEVCDPSDAGAAWKAWWMQNIPGKGNELFYNGKKLRNWLEFIADFDGALKKGKSLVSEEEEPEEPEKPEEPETPKPVPEKCETSLDCPAFERCENDICVKFCGATSGGGEPGGGGGVGEAAEKSKESGYKSIASKLNSLGHDVIGKAEIPDYSIKKASGKIMFSTDSEVHVFDQQFDSFVLFDSKGNQMIVQKRKNKLDSSSKPTHIIEFNEKSLLAIKSEAEKELWIKAIEEKTIPKNIKEKIEDRLNKHEQRLEKAKQDAIKEMLEVNPDIESRIKSAYKKVFNGISVAISEDEASKIESLPSVKNVYRNEEVQAVLEESVNQIDADEVWKLLDKNGEPITGKGVTIGIIDTGVDYTHEDVGGCLGAGCKVISGYDFVNDDNDPKDDNGHGTHVAATAAGNGILKGVAPDASIVAYKVLDAGGSGSFDDVIGAIERSADPNQDNNFDDHLDVISLSLGGPGNPDDPVSKAIDNVVNAGVVAVVAAGNSGPDSNTIGSPGTARKAITVGAVDKCDLIAGFSSRGPVSWEGGILLKPDLVAPGVSICAAQFDGWLSERQCKDEQHIAISGTSMATPHVSGVAALLLQAHPEWNPDTVKSALMSTSLDLGLDFKDQGAGRINILDAHIGKIVIAPQSISFEFEAGEQSHKETLTIKNLKNEKITASLKVAELKDEEGNVYDFASLNASELAINANSQEDVGFIVGIPNDLGGTFTGKILVELEENEYYVPFLFERLSKLTLKAIGDKPLAPDFYIHSGLSSRKEAINGGFFGDFEGDTFTFKVEPGEYTAYAIGKESDYDYILMGSIEVPVGGNAQLDLDIEDAKKFNVLGESLKGIPLQLDQWTIGFNTYDDSGIQSVFYQDPATGNKTVYASKKPDNGFDTDIVLYYHGVPAKEDAVGQKEQVNS